jgi:acyl-CoA thioester hydrolase
MNRPLPAERDAFARFQTLTTRWGDNDVYGHVNNAVYYTYFDSAVNTFLVGEGLLDIVGGQLIGLVVENQCSYFAPLSFPQPVDVGMRVGALGTSSVRYELGLFAPGATQASAQGYFVHVYVDRETRRPVPLPESWRAGLAVLQR